MVRILTAQVSRKNLKSTKLSWATLNQWAVVDGEKWWGVKEHIRTPEFFFSSAINYLLRHLLYLLPIPPTFCYTFQQGRPFYDMLCELFVAEKKAVGSRPPLTKGAAWELFKGNFQSLTSLRRHCTQPEPTTHEILERTNRKRKNTREYSSSLVCISATQHFKDGTSECSWRDTGVQYKNRQHTETTSFQRGDRHVEWTGSTEEKNNKKYNYSSAYPEIVCTLVCRFTA